MGTRSHDTELIDAVERMLDQHYRDDLGRLARRFPEDQRSLHVDWLDLWRTDDLLAEDYREEPDAHHDYLEEGLANYDLPVDVDLGDARVRVHLPADEDVLDVSDLRSDHRGRYVAVRGQVKRRSKVKPQAEQAAFECQRCGFVTTIPQEGGSFREPYECQGCERQGPFRTDYDRSTFCDRQLVRLQEPPEQAARGDGRTIDVVVRDDLADVVEAGDRVVISGIYRFEDDGADAPTYDTWLDGRAIDVEDTEYEDVAIEPYRERIEALAAGEEGDPYELLVQSLAPSITNRPTLKLALILQLFGGNPITHATGERSRGDLHVLAIGEPGCGKSTLLDAVARVAPKSAGASGKGATAAGMTATATQNEFGDGEWSLEAGALVLADGGLATIDEIDKVDGEVLNSLHDALAKQELKINKAGINTTLPTRCAVAAAGNPEHGRFNENFAPTEQIGLDPALFTRFDLVFLLRDEPDEDDDRRVASHILDYRQAGLGTADAPEAEPPVGTELLRAWVAHAKRSVHPRTPEAIREQISESYATLRNARDDEDPVPVTHRVVPAISRLAEASARVRLSDVVEQVDVDRAQRLVGASLQEVGVDPETGELDADIVEMGASKSQQDRVVGIRQLIDEMASAREGRRGVPRDELLDAAGAKGFNESNVEHTIEKLKRQRDVIEPRVDEFKVVD